jgi:hypothetical protein
MSNGSIAMIEKLSSHPKNVNVLMNQLTSFLASSSSSIRVKQNTRTKPVDAT